MSTWAGSISLEGLELFVRVDREEPGSGQTAPSPQSGGIVPTGAETLSAGADMWLPASFPVN